MQQPKEFNIFLWQTDPILSLCHISHFNIPIYLKRIVHRACYEAENMYEFDLMANKHPQDSMRTNTNEKGRGRGGSSGSMRIENKAWLRNRKRSVWKTYSIIHSLGKKKKKLHSYHFCRGRRRARLLASCCSLAFTTHGQRAWKWASKLKIPPISKTYSTCTPTERCWIFYFSKDEKLQFIHRDRN